MHAALDTSGAASGGGGSAARHPTEEGRRRGIRQERGARERGRLERKSGRGGIIELDPLLCL